MACGVIIPPPPSWCRICGGITETDEVKSHAEIPNEEEHKVAKDAVDKQPPCPRFVHAIELLGGHENVSN
ncbi:hypothetical protein MUK42_27658 [Musa troglodytarum]|uniref:Uncharacterized protein n=1 Tax=Musa troglodytarum TaxID=320322 RepID=A0A9E7FVI7_9LILI|nr:hypothetical protein MUK42_27658 [Musa troglodytarum]